MGVHRHFRTQRKTISRKKALGEFPEITDYCVKMNNIEVFFFFSLTFLASIRFSVLQIAWYTLANFSQLGRFFIDQFLVRLVPVGQRCRQLVFARVPGSKHHSFFFHRYSLPWNQWKNRQSGTDLLSTLANVWILTENGKWRYKNMRWRIEKLFTRSYGVRICIISCFSSFEAWEEEMQKRSHPKISPLRFSMKWRQKRIWMYDSTELFANDNSIDIR